MSSEKTHRVAPFSAVAVRSPMHSEGESKDQDRVSWSEALATAAVCDGLGSSPYSSEAAETAAALAPVLFRPGGHIRDRLSTIADTPVVRRIEARHRGVRVHPDLPQAIQTQLEEVAQSHLERSFQTTMVAAPFLRVEKESEARVVVVGDSVFFAFSSTGELLISSLALAENVAKKGGEAPGALAPGASSPLLRSGPGDELLVKLLGDATQHPGLAERMGIQLKSAENWLVCAPLDMRKSVDSAPEEALTTEPLSLGPRDLLLAPRYLVSAPFGPGYEHYRQLRYSRVIRSLGQTTVVRPRLQDKTVATSALPDHFYTGGWCYFSERFPMNAQFVLGTDGFYTCFSHAEGLWAWLNEHRSTLMDPEARDALLEELHQRLRQDRGDDDISFVWFLPDPTAETTANSSPPHQNQGG